MLYQHEVPIAYAMIDLINHQIEKQDPDPFQVFMCYWIAFNNIYTTIGEKRGLKPNLVIKPDGKPETLPNGSLNIPKVVEIPKETDELNTILKEFTPELSSLLIRHESTKFFVDRNPRWQGKTIKYDGFGQKLNGVINLGYTISDIYPIWKPIDIPAYNRYTSGTASKNDENLLTKQILFLLYAIRNNTIHGGKRVDDANDKEVVIYSIPLLTTILLFFSPLPIK